MKNYTTYFSRVSRLPDGVVPISISLWPPKGYAGPRCPALAPTQSILREYKADGDWDKYVRRFNGEVLSRLDPAKTFADLTALARGKSFAICCFEGSDAKCHRRLVAEWLNGALSGTPGWVPISEFKPF